MKKKLTHSRGAHAWMDRCFGRPEVLDKKGEECFCPESCRELCEETEFSERYSPRVGRSYGKSKPYTPVANSVFEAWPEFDDQLRIDSYRATYAFLLTYTRDDRRHKDSRWVWPPVRDLAVKRGISERTFRAHLEWLEENDLIERMPLRDVDPRAQGNVKTILILDLPEWWAGRSCFKKSIPDDLDIEDREELERDPEFRSDDEMDADDLADLD